MLAGVFNSSNKGYKQNSENNIKTIIKNIPITIEPARNLVFHSLKF